MRKYCVRKRTLNGLGLAEFHPNDLKMQDPGQPPLPSDLPGIRIPTAMSAPAPKQRQAGVVRRLAPVLQAQQPKQALLCEQMMARCPV